MVGAHDRRHAKPAAARKRGWLRGLYRSTDRRVIFVTDAELVAGLKNNDDAAFREVVARYGDPLYGYIYSITGNHHFSEDILSETYLRMVEKIDTYTFY